MMYFEIANFDAMRFALDEMCRRLQKEQIFEDAVFSCRLVADELVSNVLRHGGGTAYFRAERKGDAVLLSVRGDNGFRPPERSVPADVLSECGRGLFLVDRFCEKREYTEADGIRVVIKIRPQTLKQ